MASKFGALILSVFLLAGCAGNAPRVLQADFWKGDAGTLAVLVYIDREKTPEARMEKAQETKLAAQAVLSVLDNAVDMDVNAFKAYVFSELDVFQKPLSQQFLYGKLVDGVIADLKLPESATLIDVEGAKEVLKKLIETVSLYGV